MLAFGGVREQEIKRSPQELAAEALGYGNVIARRVGSRS
jgi:hypothetical protein